MKIVSLAYEKLILRSMLGNENVSSYVFSRVNKDHFAFPPCAEMYQRISKLAQKTGELPDWDDLLEDPAVSEDTRNILKKFSKKPIASRRRASRVCSKLDDYRKIRTLFNNAEHVINTIKGENVDVEELIEKTSNSVLAARTSSEHEQVFWHLGAKSSNKKISKFQYEILRGKKLRYIPTGFKAFDSINRGIALGSCMIIAASTGGGKSTLALQMSTNQAYFGARVAFGSFEMEIEELMLRHMANITGRSMSQLIYSDKLAKSEHRDIVQQTEKWRELVRKRGGMLSLFCPTEDMSIEEVLMSWKAYKFDVNTIDYLGLLKGMDGDDQWRRLGAGARFSKRFAASNKNIVTLLAQLSEEGILRYSKTLGEHANNFWKWVYNNDARENHLLNIQQGKARNQKAFDFVLQEDFDTMSITDFEGDELETGKRSKKERAQMAKDALGNITGKSQKNKKNDYLEV